VFHVEEEIVCHLVHEGRLVCRLHERDQAVHTAVRRCDITLRPVRLLLVELLNDLDCLIIEDDKATTVAASVVGDALDTDLVQSERGGLRGFV